MLTLSRRENHEEQETAEITLELTPKEAMILAGTANFAYDIRAAAEARRKVRREVEAVLFDR
ncbi:hypothetical protein [Paenibacillus sp. UNC499MF]|uniref:hypothetical protein n=1 Tax=Paenibacillus sp. UNC499MF TaxID=1502751 RepID=UPI00089FD4FA|nr:hypothetical protein [Paenibacillus sp. UNC499MF]SEF82274.1 hypothetical protein SAMN02799616_01110 [Paenibacillus sp. UNC499MF]